VSDEVEDKALGTKLDKRCVARWRSRRYMLAGRLLPGVRFMFTAENSPPIQTSYTISSAAT
jgi:hypothetical protein